LKVLAVDSTSSLLGIGLLTESSYFERNTDIGLHHTENLTPGIEKLLKTAGMKVSDLDLIVVSKGPGSFTGLRIGMAAGKGLSFAGAVPLVSVPTLEVWSMGKKFFPGIVLPVLDARKKRVYTAFFEKGKRCSDYLDISPSDLLEACGSFGELLLTGPYAPQLLQLWKEEATKDLSFIHLDPQYGSPHTWELLHLGIKEYARRGADPEAEGPLYIRPSEAEASLLKRDEDG
jgi:tRNA threonylcarbamoyladenosine biosynthesis protein TsaB